MPEFATKIATVGCAADADRLLVQLVASADRVRGNLRDLLEQYEGALDLLRHLKFQPAGCDPLDADRPLNFVEQLNQTLTYQATLHAAVWLLKKHPEHAPFTLNLGTSPGVDISSNDGQLVAEVFAAVDPRNNSKLLKDMARVRNMKAPLKYVLYLSPTTGGWPDEYESAGVRVRRLTTT